MLSAGEHVISGTQALEFIRDRHGVGNGTDNGTGVTIAIVDAYDSPTLLSDAQEYFTTNDPSHPLTTSQFTNDEPTKVDDQTECGGSGWYPEPLKKAARNILSACKLCLTIDDQIQFPATDMPKKGGQHIVVIAEELESRVWEVRAGGTASGFVVI